MAQDQPDDSRDVVALLRLQSTYADIVSRRAWEELHTIFVPDVDIEIDTVSSPARQCSTAREFIDFVSTAVARFDHFQFVILNSVVDVDDDGSAATGRIFMCEIRHAADDSSDEDGWSTAYGLYQDRYRKTGGTWWVTQRRYRSLARTGSNAGIFGVPPDLPGFGR
jgi:SnoaL-like domain